MEMKEQDINEIMEHYYHLKQKESLLKNDLDTFNKMLKDYFIKNDLEKFEGDNFKATVSKRETVKWVEPVLIERLKKLGFGELVKTKEYVDMKLLEDYLYTNQIKETKIRDCKTVSEVITLKVSEVKK